MSSHYPIRTAVAALPLALSTVCSARAETLDEVVVTAHPLSAEGIAQAAIVLEGHELDKTLDTTLGATLASQPGIHAGSYGTASGRPVIHGLAGPRVRVMEDRLDALDASVTSADHAVTIEPFLADRIEVIKGASALLYGSGAIGGVVDVHTGRIPHQALGRPFGVRGEARVDDASDQTFGAVRANGDVGAFTWHLDGFHRDGNPYEIPGFAESTRLRAGEADDGDDGDEAFGIVPGSDLRTDGGAVGLAWVGDRGFAGFSVSTIDSRYGIPGGHGHEHGDEDAGVIEEEEEEEGNATIDLEQLRIDVEAGLSAPLRGFETLNVRLGFNDYEHTEIEPSGEPGTVFGNDALDARIELVHLPIAGQIAGTLGAQYTQREFSAIGEEAFVPPVDSESAGLFWVGERTFQTVDVEAGVRLERTRYEPQGGSDEDFTTFAVSLGTLLDVGTQTRLGLHADLSTRAPVAEELYSDGPHLATGTFEIGNAGLDSERALNVSATLSHSTDRLRAAATLYAIDFDDFIYQAETGAVEDELPVFAYRQEAARFVGLDLEFGWTLARPFGGSLELTGLFDTVDAKLDVAGNDRLPRIPTTRVGAGLAFAGERLSAGVDVIRGLEQTDVATFELPTDAYTDLRIDVAWRMPIGDGFVETFVYGRNLLDDEIRDHTSFVKDLVPAPGRRLEAGLRVAF